MSSAGRIYHIIKHESRAEWKNKQALTSLLIYSLTSIFITYLVFREHLEPVTWNALYWIILLFAATNAVARSFMQESRGLQFYYYTLINPRELILARIMYNSFLLIFLALINYVFYSLLFDTPVQNSTLFLSGLILGCMGLSATLTLVSGIVSRASGNAALVAILGFPLLFPLLITLIRFSTAAISGENFESNLQLIMVLFALDIAIVMLSYLLFPYLWRD